MTSQPSIDEFMKAVGRILTLWGKVEVCLGFLFQGVTSGVISNSPLMSAYWAVVAFQARQKMTDAALSEAFRHHPDYLSTWKELNKRLDKMNKTRNKIAHGSVIVRSSTQDPAFVPFFHSRMVENFDPQTGRLRNNLTVEDLNVIAASMLELVADIQDFWQRYCDEQIWPDVPTQSDGSKTLPQFRYPRPPSS